jgi:hypothetical protein
VYAREAGVKGGGGGGDYLIEHAENFLNSCHWYLGEPVADGTTAIVVDQREPIVVLGPEHVHQVFVVHLEEGHRQPNVRVLLLGQPPQQHLK